MHDVWTISEVFEGKFKLISYELLARGRSLANDLNVKLGSIVIGSDITKEELEKLAHYGADEIFVADSPEFALFNCQTFAQVLLPLIETHQPQVILAGATSSGRTLMPYIAVKAHAGLTADCTSLAIEPETGNLLQTRPAIGGNIMATIKTPNHRPQMATVRPRSTKILEPNFTKKASVTEVDVTSIKSGAVTVLGLRTLEGQHVSIEEASIVVGGGKGLKKKDNFTMIERLASALEGEVGASRDAVDRGWVTYPHQIGLSGKTISPRLYVAVGVSGAIQHLAGIKTAECIVAINSDENANILDLADFAVVGDLFSILPELERQLAQRREA